MPTFDNTLSLYDYSLPDHLIAKEPAHPRDSAKLLIYDRATGDVSFDVFSNITAYLPQNAVLVLNETRVLPAKIHLAKETGGTIEALYLETKGRFAKVWAKGHLKPGDKLTWQDGYFFTVESRDEKEAFLLPSFPIKDLQAILEEFGETPLPPYLGDSPLPEDVRRREYQTVFAQTPGSVAAPTAGLHFTESLMRKIEDHGCDIARITLHVNLGTFAPLTEENLTKKMLHEERYSIDPITADLLNSAKEDVRPIIAVGTTTVRALESASNDDGILENLSGTTRIFIDEDTPLRFCESLITNFHVPKSSLMMLVSAFTGREKLLELYDEAIDHEYRFFSFGDGMIVL